jgi:hypothetical protein
MFVVELLSECQGNAQGMLVIFHALAFDLCADHRIKSPVCRPGGQLNVNGRNGFAGLRTHALACTPPPTTARCPPKCPPTQMRSLLIDAGESSCFIFTSELDRLHPFLRLVVSVLFQRLPTHITAITALRTTIPISEFPASCWKRWSGRRDSNPRRPAW